MSRSRSSPRKFSEKIALLNKREADTTAEFEKIIQEVEATTRAPPSPRYRNSPTLSSSYGFPEDTSSACFDNSTACYNEYQTSNNPSYQQQQFHQDQRHGEVSETQHQHHLHYQQPSTSSHMGLVPNIEISHTDEDNIYYPQQQVNNNIVPNDRSSSMSAARSLPDIANLRVNSPNDCLSSSYSDQRLRSNTISNNYDLVYHTTHSNDLSQDTGFSFNQLQQEPDICFRQPQQQPAPPQTQQQAVVMMDNQSVSGSHHEYYHPSQQHQQNYIVRANSSSAVMGNWSNNNSLYTPKMNNVFSRSSEDCCGNLDNLDLEDLM